MTPEERADSVVGVAARYMHDVYIAMHGQAIDMIRAAIAEEREACAKECERLASEWRSDDWDDRPEDKERANGERTYAAEMLDSAAAFIRARPAP